MRISYENNSPNKLEKIATEINQNPGIRFNELLRKTEIPSGTLMHYVKQLEKRKVINIKRESRQTRYFSIDVKNYEVNTIIAFRKPTLKNILLCLMNTDYLSLPMISEAIKKSPPTCSVALAELTDIGLVESALQGRKKTFKVIDKNSILKITQKYCI
ncbi:hypothetical protein C6988_03765 [Nitrosopumilus sp. b1]|uniref:winged helix-turn-helix transcriptional regulator n=1 Tax=Nitrosopumilus sp. b1 TaxID=2109907 RepID=UPI0015F36B93|nr:winged helix-turn-helix transcriptional regulator [Nitrosopumilus sp. b1]KAF6243371.1 hypothetical protein C6988_03765 [Nitrosopumilus sp. b1]